MDGYGTLEHHPDRALYEGEMRRGKKHGWGTMLFQDGRRYCGEWRDGQAHGRGFDEDVEGLRRPAMYRDGERTRVGVVPGDLTARGPATDRSHYAAGQTPRLRVSRSNGGFVPGNPSATPPSPTKGG